MSEEETGGLLADPTFQLNLLLWMHQQLPTAGSPTSPKSVLRDAGYAVHAVGAKLVCSGELEEKLAVDLELRGAPQPDMVASAPGGTAWPVWECKASGFGTNSSTTRQALKILARSRDVAIVAGAQPGREIPGAAIWLTRADDANALNETLDDLAAQLAEDDVAAATSGVVGIDLDVAGVTAQAIAGDVPEPLQSVLAQPIVVLPRADDSEQNPRPLYFIPFDPGVQQEPEEVKRCLDILLDRARMEAASVIGLTATPAPIVLQGHELLSAATFGMSARWQDHGDRQKAAAKIVSLLEHELSMVSDRPLMRSGEGAMPHLDITVHNDDQRDALVEAIVAAAPSSITELPAAQPKLFDE